MRTVLLQIVLTLLPIAGPEVAYMETGPQVVLVSSETATIPPLSTRELRKLYLGIVVIKHGLTIKPLVNRCDPELFQLFLQKVLHVSERNYKRQLLSRVFRLGGERPKSFADETRLLHTLREGTDQVTYLPLDEARQSPGIKVIQTLW